MIEPFYLLVGTKGFPMFHTCKVQQDGTYIITGCDPGQTIVEGAFVSGSDTDVQSGKIILVKSHMVVKQVLERRDHKGVFNNPSDRVNSYFKAIITQK